MRHRETVIIRSVSLYICKKGKENARKSVQPLAGCQKKNNEKERQLTLLSEENNELLLPETEKIVQNIYNVLSNWWKKNFNFCIVTFILIIWMIVSFIMLINFFKLKDITVMGRYIVTIPIRYIWDNIIWTFLLLKKYREILYYIKSEKFYGIPEKKEYVEVENWWDVQRKAYRKWSSRVVKSSMIKCLLSQVLNKV